MYHFKPTEHAPETTVLNEHTELSGRAIKFLKDFQIGAVRFLFEQFCKRDFSILNDESGLGKAASVAVFLGIVAARKNCLVVVSNNAECVTGWRFHFDILTDLKVSELNEEKDYDATGLRIYIVKWNVLRAIGDLSKLNFDLIVLDNREQILSNTFCMSTLLKNFEKKVKLVISSVDVTSDVKLLHNILRLGGRLEHQFESFKAFEQRFKLPDLKAISSKKSDLEDYFLRREILNDYCKDFRLRRYRHQYENILPLVDPVRYKTFLSEWQVSTNEKAENAALLIGEPLPNEIDTEELLEQYQTNPSIFETTSTSAPAPEDNDIIKITNESQNKIPPSTALDITDDVMEMPPLVFLTDSEDVDEEEDVIFLSSESAASAAAAIPVIDIVEDEEEQKNTPENAKTSKVKQEKISPKKQPETLKENNTPNSTMKTRQKNRRKSTNPQQLIANKKAEIQSPKAQELSTPRTRRNKQVVENSRTKIGNSSDLKKSKVNVKKKTPASAKQKEQDSKEAASPSQVKKLKFAEKIKIKAEKTTPKKNEMLEIENPQKKVDSSKKAENTSSGSKNSNSNQNEEAKTNMIPAIQKTPNVEERRNRKRVMTPISAPLRDTRNMQRKTRSSGGQQKCFMLDFDDDNKKTRTRLKGKSKVNVENEAKTTRTTKAKVAATTMKKTDSPKDKILAKTIQQSTKQLDTKAAQKSLPATTKKETRKSKTAANKVAPLPISTQCPVLPMSSEYEEIPCGQKLVYSSSNDNTPPLFQKPNDFLMPSTPPSYRATQFSISRLASIDSDSDAALLMPPSSSQKRKSTAKNSVIVLSSSQDEASLSSQASSVDQRRPSHLTSSAAGGVQKRKRLSKRMSLPITAVSTNNKEPLTFGDLLAKQRNTAKSPDLFSVGSDGGILTQGCSSNALPFTQPNGKASTIANSPIFGFKIFGSEVRNHQTPTSKVDKEKSSSKSMRTSRSCLNILEQMFENNEETASNEKKKSSTDKTKAKDLRKSRKAKVTNTTKTTDAIEATTPASTIKSSRKKPLLNSETSSSPQATPRNLMHERERKTLAESDDIFEITNNATFGSTLRITTSGHISPVATANTSQYNNPSHNKITNYLIGNSGINEQMLSTPKKRRQKQQQEQQSVNSFSGDNGTPIAVATTQTRKSPKSAKSTQTTKLTKWFRRSSVDDNYPAAGTTIQKTNHDGRDESIKSAKLVKRRRLNLSSKS